jgi:inner membrane protein
VASLGHNAVGVAASRIYPAERPARRAPLASPLFWSALSFFPDADVIGFSFGIEYAGLNCALFWPFALTRYFAPWRPIPVSPIGLGYLSPYGMLVAIFEVVVFSPLF